MGLIFWWMLIAWLIVGAGYGLIRLWRKKHEAVDAPSHRVPIAHSERLLELPAYQEAVKRYRVLLRVGLISLSISLLAAVLLTARPARIALITPASQSRDIMLCLDVSGSLLRTDTMIVNRFSAVVNSFETQRVGLTLFNSSSSIVLPLSDDYQLINAQLKTVGTAFQQQKGADFDRLTSGTLAAFDKGTSLVSDGLVSCINNMGNNPLHRSQSVVLATDNEKHGTPIIAMEQAVGLAQNRNIRIYAIDPGVSDVARHKDHDELKTIAEKTGGSYHTLDDENAVPSIVTDIESQEAKYQAGVQVVASSDWPAPLLYITVIMTLLSVLIIERLKT